MKKLILIAFFGLSVLFADATMQKSMNKMENGLSLIQKGFLYNNAELVNLGIKDIESGNKLFGEKEMKDYLPKDKQHMTNQAKLASSKIDEALKEINAHLKNREYMKSHEAFGKVVTACAACHSLVRSW